MDICKHFHYSTSVEDALQALGNAKGNVKLLAGGTDLLLDLQQGRHSPVDTLVDITNISELNLLEDRQKALFVGAAVPLQRITNSSLVREHAQVLTEASSLIGGPQVRNVATLGGNVAHALPAADGTIALVALDAQVEIATLENRRMVSISDLFKGPGLSAIDPCKELLVGFYIPQKAKGQASAFQRIMRPQGVAIAILNCAVWLQRKDDLIEDVRISIGPSGPIPKRLKNIEQELRGKLLEEAALDRACDILSESVNFRTSKHRATQEYREKLAGVLLRDTFRSAWERAGLLGVNDAR